MTPRSVVVAFGMIENPETAVAAIKNQETKTAIVDVQVSIRTPDFLQSAVLLFNTFSTLR